MSTETDLLQAASDEIKMLRRHNEIMSARLEMFDTLTSLLHPFQKQPTTGMSDDVAWQIDRYLISKES